MSKTLQCVCCMATEDLFELFGEVNNENESYAEKLLFSLNIEIDAESYSSICQSCAGKLDKCVIFKNQILDSLTILGSTDEHLKYVDENSEIMYEDYDHDINQEFHDTELNKTIIKDNNVNSHIKIFLNSVKETLKSSKNAKESTSTIKHVIRSIIKDNKHDYIDESVYEENQDELKVESKRKPRPNVMDAMPYTIDETERLCRECDEEFPTNLGLKIHYRTHFGQHICKICNKRYMTAASLSKHKSTHKTGPFRCSDCGQEFSNINGLHKHKQVKHRHLSFKCRHCTDRFRTYNQKLTHEVDIHKEEMKYKCPHCDKRFIHSVAKINHVNNVHKIIIVECNLCGANFKKNYIKKHMFKKHNIGKGWQCSICPARRPNKADLRKHMLVHAETPRYVCKLCNKGFSTRCALRYHIDKHITRLEYNGDPDDITDCKYQAGDLDMGEVTRCEDRSLDPEDVTEVAVHYNLHKNDVIIEQVVEEVKIEELEEY